ncbi:DUF1295 domain-containing protein [Leptospira sp. 96542]|nr:DUF1295 domain-containing protein [Leptospira sp. 96542]
MWYWGKSRNNYAVIDVGWGLVIAGIASVLCAFGSGTTEAKLAVLIPVWVWALRLSGFLYFTRIRTNHPEDKRYADFRKDYGDKVHQKFFTNVFMLQGLLALLLSPTFLFASNWQFYPNGYFYSSNGAFYPSLGGLLFIIGFLGETIADRQLFRFVSNPSNKGLVCNIGLWKYTRHPNYFFEWVIWLGIGFIPFSQNPFSLVAPLVMFVLLRFISGVPFAEKYSLISKPERFKEYQKTTNAFFPWFPSSLKK